MGAWLADRALEGSIVGSFSRIGPVVRSRTERWVTPPRMEGKTVLVTGATSGIGYATAVGVARLGARVVVTGRDEERTGRAAKAICTAVPGADVEPVTADMGDLDQVRALALRVDGRGAPLDVLVHNAGALHREYQVAPGGIEATVASQLVGPFLLTGLLLSALSRAACRARVVQVSSGGMYSQRFDLGALEMTEEDYDGVVAYARVKRAQLVLGHEWVRRLGAGGPAMHAMHPGWVDTPGIAVGLPAFRRVMGPLLRSAEAGADTVTWLAASEEAGASTGGFWLDRKRRWEHKVPWTRLEAGNFATAGSALWSWCADRSGWDGLTPNRDGLTPNR